MTSIARNLPCIVVRRRMRRHFVIYSNEYHPISIAASAGKWSALHKIVDFVFIGTQMHPERNDRWIHEQNRSINRLYTDLLLPL